MTPPPAPPAPEPPAQTETTTEPPALLPPAPARPACPALAAPKRKPGLGLRAARSGRTLTVRIRGRAKVTVTVQAPCGARRAAARRTVRTKTKITLPKLASGSVITVRATSGKKTAVAVVRVS
ncbi:MAG: hypothetical protein V9E83_08840 [Baekduia sp.]